jgi:hypothetical protein
MFSRLIRVLPLCAALLPPCSVGSASAAEPVYKPTGPVVRLFDGKSLDGWKSCKFGGEGEVRVADGAILLEMGSDMTGIVCTQACPKINYEISLEAKRVEGGDFFCGLTFPVAADPCSLIVGGWGGGTVGLSSIDDADASENETTTFHSFDNNRWYKIRLRVTTKMIEAWIDQEQIVKLNHEKRRITIRSEVELCKPLGFATWSTTAALRNIELRRLAPAE